MIKTLDEFFFSEKKIFLFTCMHKKITRIKILVFVQVWNVWLINQTEFIYLFKIWCEIIYTKKILWLTLILAVCYFFLNQDWYYYTVLSNIENQPWSCTCQYCIQSYFLFYFSLISSSFFSFFFYIYILVCKLTMIYVHEIIHL